MKKTINIITIKSYICYNKIINLFRLRVDNIGILNFNIKFNFIYVGLLKNRLIFRKLKRI